MRAPTRPRPDSTHRASIDFLKFILSLVVIVSLSVIYLLLDANYSNLSVGRLLLNLLPSTIVAVGIFPVVYLILQRIEGNFEERMLSLVNTQSTIAEHCTGDVAGFSEKAHALIRQKARKKKITIDLLCFTCATFTTAFLRDLIHENPNRISLNVTMIDFDKVPRSYLPIHWPSEADETLVRLQEVCKEKASLKIGKHPHLPFMIGLAIDESDLFFTFPTWDLERKKITDRSLDYLYTARSPQSEFLFDTFYNWFRAPDIQAVLSPTKSSN